MTNSNHPKQLLTWYQKYRRDLPWRAKQTPYHIWISEIILQQTRVEQGLPYYLRFIKSFPDVATLAKASPTEVLYLWEGLGYYRRALNMHKTANLVINQYDSVFPSEYDQLIKLPGIGDYTASAISSICSGEKRPAIDGNVRRFIARLYNIHEVPDRSHHHSEIRKLALSFSNHADSGTMNQAMMEFGALQCVPGKPNCLVCPFKDCMAYKEGVVELLPVKKAKRGIRSRYFHYYLFFWSENNHHYYLVSQRDDNDIWPHLYDFPMLETTSLGDPLDYNDDFAGLWIEPTRDILIKTSKGSEVQQLTHQRIYARFFECKLPGEPTWHNEGLLKVTFEELMQLPKPRLINRYLETKMPFLS